MHRDVHRYLDGETPRSALPADALAELEAWERVETDTLARRSEVAPAWLADSVMRSIDAHEARSAAAAGAAWWQRALQWLVTPRPLQVRPLAPLAAAAALVLVILVQATGDDVPAMLADADAVAAPADAPVIYVQFTLAAGDARTVSVAGDFNDWSVEAGTLRDVDGSGVFRGLIAVRPGVHKYMFVVDGEEWVTDPAAERYVDDGFGMRNALLAIVPPTEVL
jgi:hypothetical protein